jgi:hypothetical protein
MDAIRQRVSTCLALIAVLSVVAGLSLSGCGVSSASSNTTQVWGNVTVDGKPASDGTIIFMPSDRSLTNWGAGSISKGRYVISAWQGNGVLEPGQYTIFFKFHTSGHATRPAQSRLQEREEPKAGGTEAAPVADVPTPLDKFTRPETSGLSVKVRKEPSRIDIRLKG